MSDARKVTVRHAGEGTAIAVVGDLYTFLAVGGETGGRYALWDAVVAPGGGPPPHIQTREDEGFYVLEGEVAFYADGARVLARRGTFLNVPPGVLHSFRNETGQDARMLILVGPAGLERMFWEAGQIVEERPARPRPPAREEIEKLLAAAPRYGVEVRLPPPAGA
jgi:mannose-6-phosphate isomerase-like protein (cupin superfamily)